MANIAVFCSGNGSNFQAILDAVKKKKLRADIRLMVCDNPKAYALERAKKHDIPVVLISPKHFKHRRDYEKLIVRILKLEKIDLVVLAGFMRIFTPYFIKAYRNKILNVHPSYLPAFKGAHPIRDAFQSGAKETGVSVHLVTKDLDAGPILKQERVKIAKGDTFESLEKRIHLVEHRIYPLAIKQFLAKSV